MAKEVSKNVQEDEDDKVKQYGNEINSYINSDREQIMVDKDEYLQLKNNVEKINASRKSVEFTLGSSASSVWTKVSDYPEGFSYDNCYFQTGYITNNTHKWTLEYKDSGAIAQTRLSSDGIYMAWSSMFCNMKVKLILQKDL